MASEEGILSLEGNKNATSDALIYSASLALWHLGRYNSVKEAALVVRKTLSSGKAADRFYRAA